MYAQAANLHQPGSSQRLHDLKPRRAFTLLEVLVAVGILGGALVVILSSVEHSARMQRRAITLVHQAILADSLMNELLCRSDIHEGDHESGVFEEHPLFTWNWRAEEIKLPFFEDEFVERKSGLIKLTLEVKHERSKAPPTILVEYRGQEKQQ